jgi:WD40 repeat protein
LAFSPDGTILASGGYVAVRLSDATSGDHLLDLTGGSEITTGLAFSRDARTLARSAITLFRDARCYVCELGYGRGVRTFRGLAAPAERVWFAANGSRLAAVAQDLRVAVWEMKTGRLLFRFPGPPGVTADNVALAFSRDGRYVAVAGGEEVQLWNLPARRLVCRPWHFPNGLVNQLAFDGEGRLRLFRAEREEEGTRTCLLRELRATGAEPPPVPLSRPYKSVYDAVLSPDGTTFVVEGVQDGPAGTPIRTIRAFDGTTGAERWSILTTRTAASAELTIDPSGKFLGCAVSAR